MSEWYGLRTPVVKERTMPPPPVEQTTPDSDADVPPDEEPVPDE
jgi:hypothetical protein